jgi:hypothetical protein
MKTLGTFAYSADSIPPGHRKSRHIKMCSVPWSTFAELVKSETVKNAVVYTDSSVQALVL